MLTELCQELRNWFVHKKYIGTFSIENGKITADFLADGQYFRIIGSIFNDGVHQYPTTGLADEVFDGEVWALAIPQAVINLDTVISEWQQKYGGADSFALSPFQSESFGGYSRSKGASGNANGNAGVSWQSAFASQLNKWRKI
jgi:hypothetical protein